MRMLVVAEPDSYVKWAVSRTVEARATWDVDVVVVRSAVTPSAEQVAAAVDGRLTAPPPLVSYSELVQRLRRDPPDALLLACRGPLIDFLVRELYVDGAAADGPGGGSSPRPAIAAGIPGIWNPPTSLGLRLRRGVDLLVVHSHAERAAVTDAVPGAVGLASLVRSAPDSSQGDTPAPAASDAAPRPRIVFAPQALVPSSRDDRLRILRALVQVARSHPELDVVIKVRGRTGEAQTHDEDLPYPELLGDIGGDSPSNLIIGHGPLRESLVGAIGFATVSSTAVLEAIEAGVPSLCLDDFGVSAGQINLVFEGSGLLGSLEALARLDFRSPSAAWLRDNYFHEPAEDDWLSRLEVSVADARAGARPRVAPAGRGPRSWLERQRNRRIALGAEDSRGHRLTGLLAAIVLAVVRRG